LRTAGGFTGVSVELLYRKISTSKKIKEASKKALFFTFITRLK